MTDNLPAEPRQKVKLALFALSSNCCTYPDCDALIFEADSIVGDICHIRARAPGGPRYEEGLRPDELHGLDNLILLCKKHHKIVDDHPEEFSIERLLAMKASHEADDRSLEIPWHRLIDALVPSVPDNWWERPSAPELRLGLASTRAEPTSWWFNIGIRQIDGGDIGNFRCRVLHPSTSHEIRTPDKRETRHWQLPDIQVSVQGAPFELQLIFWWDGAERTVRHTWPQEADFQSANVQVEWS